MNFENFKKLLSSAPRWMKIVVSALVAVVAGFLLFLSVSSCSAIRITGSSGSTSVKVSQSALDSAKIQINYEPR